MNVNPFKVIKATNLPPDDVVNLWVDNSTKSTVSSLLSPESPAPIILLGGKGSGKTHILRYCSYRSQKVRAQKLGINIFDLLKMEGYFSVYLELSDFQFNRFSNLNTSIFNVDEIYFYYLNIIVSEIFLSQIIDLIDSDLSLKECFDCRLFKVNISEFIFDDFIDEINSIEDLLKVLKRLHKQMDQDISYLNNGVRSQLPIKFLFSPRDNRLFDVIYAVMSSMQELRDVRVMVLIDQFEDLGPNQQVYVNTILRHVKWPELISVRIAGRLYAVKTKSTYSANEKLLNAEAETKYIESFMLSDHDEKSKHESFSINLCKLRVKNYWFREISDDLIRKSFPAQDFSEINERIIKKYPLSMDRYHFKVLKAQLLQDKFNEKDILSIINDLSCPNNALLEKKNIYLFYQRWSKGDSTNLLHFSSEIKDSLLGNQPLHSSTTLSHLEKDFQYQLIRDFKQSYLYTGFDTILQITEHNPRSFVNLLSFMYEYGIFSEEELFSGKGLSFKVQDRAIRAASEYFWNDAICDVEDSHEVMMISRLCGFFKDYRLVNKPYEKTLISFAYDPNLVNSDCKKILDRASTHSLIIEDRKGKKAKNNSTKLLKKFNINPMLTIKWDLPTVVGGSIELTGNFMNALCCGDDSTWKHEVSLVLRPLSAPFESNKKSNKTRGEQNEIQVEMDL